MLSRRFFKAHKRGRANSGFTLIEALLAVVVLGLTASGIGALYSSGLQSLSVQDDGMLLDSCLVSRMEYLLSQSFDQIVGGSEVVTVNGTGYTITWTAPLVDLNGDATPESDAKQVTLAVTGMPGKSLTAIVVDNHGRVGKIL